MFRLADVLRILEGLREEAREAAENPDESKQTEFGFGRVAGMLQVTSRAIAVFTEEANDQAERDRAPEQPSFEGDDTDV